MTIKVPVRGNRLKTAGGLRVAKALRTGSTEPSEYVPAGGYILRWSDEFNTYNVADPYSTSIGEIKWAPYWKGWNVRAISGNSDDGFKCADFEKLDTPTGTQPYTVTQLFDNDGTFTSHKLHGCYLHSITPNDTLIMRAYPALPSALAGAYEVNPFYDYPYIGSMLSTEMSYVWGYGYVEVRFRIVNYFIGMHFSIWLLSKSLEWPPEIDILEVLGHAPQTWYSNVHGDPATTEVQWQTVSTYADWHTLGFLRTATELKWYLDGVLFRTTANYLSPTNLPMFFLMTHEMAGNWETTSPGGEPPAGTGAPWPASWEFEYVRIYTL